MYRNDSLAKIGNILSEAEKIIILPHTDPDGDALGSGIGLCIALKKSGTHAQVILDEKIPSYLDFLDSSLCSENEGDVDGAYVCVCVDCSERNRLENRTEIFDMAETRICIDHHVSDDNIGDFNYIDKNSAATAQIIYELIREMGIEVDSEIAKHLYTGIVTDTGCFRYSNTTARTHDIASELLKIGVPHGHIMIRIFQNKSVRKVITECSIIDTMEIFAEGKAALAYVTEKMLKSVSADISDTEGIVDKLRDIEGVEIAVFLKENGHKIKLSLRAKSYADVEKIASKFNGGGHVKAAGCVINDTMEKAVSMIKDEITRNLLKSDGSDELL